MLQKYASRKFVLATAFFLLVILNQTQKWGINTDDLLLIFGAVSSFIITEGAVDYKKAVTGANTIADDIQSIKSVIEELTAEYTEPKLVSDSGEVSTKLVGLPNGEIKVKNSL